MKKLVCKNCGVVNVVSLEALAEDDDEQWLQCTLPEGFEWILPAGKITPVIGEPIYVSAMGEHLSYDAYLDMYNIDPEIAYTMMRGRIGTRTATKIMSNQSKIKASLGSRMRSRNWLNEDDWTA
ncbi:MAG TPA: hypothetical protein VMY43_04385 [Methanothrix sp.]|jgi:hypothetical protein|nr:hypothetical protein [Methanothrix sp.]